MIAVEKSEKKKKEDQQNSTNIETELNKENWPGVILKDPEKEKKKA